MGGFKLDLPVDMSDRTTDKLDLVKKILHLVTVAADLLTICVVAPMIAIEARYLGAGRPAPNYTLFVAITSLPVPFLLVYFPWMYEKYNKFKRLGKFCMKNRTNIIFCSFNTLMWATASIAITVHSNNASNCAYNSDLTEEYGNDYSASWGTQCNLGKVTSAFTWITCIIWLATLAITFIHFWKEKTLIQEKLNEHRLSKQQKLEERHQDEENRNNQPEYGRTHGYEEESPFTDQYQSKYQEPSPQTSPYNHGDDYRRTSYTPVFDGNAIQPGQYVDHNPVVFSPMPTPQHMPTHMSPQNVPVQQMPPHPDPTYYNNNF